MVLAEYPEHHNLAFRVGLFGLEMARPPASTKSLEVGLNLKYNLIVSLAFSYYVKRILLLIDYFFLIH